MEALIVLFLLACLLTFVGGILGLIAFARIGTLSLEVRRLQARVAELTRSSAGEGEGVAEQNDIPSTTDDASERQPAVPPTAPPETPAVQPLSSASAPSTQSPRIDDPGPADAASGGRGQGRMATLLQPQPQRQAMQHQARDDPQRNAQARPEQALLDRILAQEDPGQGDTEPAQPGHPVALQRLHESRRFEPLTRSC